MNVGLKEGLDVRLTVEDLAAALDPGQIVAARAAPYAQRLHLDAQDLGSLLGGEGLGKQNGPPSFTMRRSTLRDKQTQRGPKGLMQTPINVGDRMIRR